MDLKLQEDTLARFRANKLGALRNMIVVLNQDEGDYSDYVNFATKRKRTDGKPGSAPD